MCHLYPLRQFAPLVGPGESLVGEHHDAVVRLAPERPPHALRGVPHGVEGEEVVLPDVVLQRAGFKQFRERSVVVV